MEAEWWCVFPCDTDELECNEAVQLMLVKLYLDQLRERVASISPFQEWIPNPFRHIRVAREVE